MKKMNKGFTLIELIIVIAILGIIALIAIPNLAGIRQRSQVSADIRTAEQIGKAIRIWQTDTDAATTEGKQRVIPGYDADNDTDDILYYAYEEGGEGFYKFAGVDYYVGVDYKAKSMSPTATYFISSIGSGSNQKVIVGIAELNDDGKTPNGLTVGEDWVKSNISANWYTDGSAAGWAYVEQ